MQNRYTGDIGDFGKLGLLRQLQLNTRLSIGVNWYLIPDESHNRDGHHHLLYINHQRGKM